MAGLPTTEAHGALGRQPTETPSLLESTAMEKIRELLSRLKELTAEELTELRSLILDEFKSLDAEETTAENVAAMNELADAGEQSMAEANERDAQAEQAEADRQVARDRIAALNPEEAEDTPETPDADVEETPEADADVETPEATPEPVAASGAVRKMARRAKPALSPEAQGALDAGPPPAVLTASGELQRHLRGKNIDDRQALGEAMAHMLSSMPRTGSARGDVMVASASWTYPEDRHLDGENVSKNEEVFRGAAHPDALIATGGVCLPVNVDYAVPTWATAERPIRDALPSYQASRGGVRYVQPPDIAGATGLGAGGGLTTATGIWTEATDASPGAATKPVVSIACGSEQLVYVEAISTRLGFGNMQSRFAPEQIAANTDLAIAAAASVAERNLLNLIATSCVATVAQPAASTGLGATRDLISGLHEAVAAFLDAHRLPDNQNLTGVFPRWLKRLIKVDLAREIGHSQNQYFDALKIPDEYVESLFTNAGVNPIWHLDGQSTSAPGLGGSVNQYYVIQTASGPILKFPTQVAWYLFPEGTMQFLDGGRLDLGVVRDSTLDATNDYETFVESFEGIAFRGFASAAIQYVSTISALGASAATVSVTQAA